MIPVNDLSRELRFLEGDLSARFSAFLDAGWMVNGLECSGFEQDLANYLNVAYAHGVGNGTDALRIAMLSLEIEAGDYVAMTGNAGGYSATAAMSIGAIPAWFDVDWSGKADPNSLDNLLLKADEEGLKIKAVVVTHLFGQLADVDRIMTIAKAFGVRVIEDCAQSIGAGLTINALSLSGDVATLSFYPTKNLGALGDGGAVVTNSDELSRRIAALKQYGWVEKYKNDIRGGFNSRLDEIQASFLRLKLPYLDIWNARRVQIMNRYLECASPSFEAIINPVLGYNGHLGVFKVSPSLRTSIRDAFKDKGVATDVHYPIPDHMQNAFSGVTLVPLNNTEAFCRGIVSVPLFAFMEEDEVDQICALLGRRYE